MEESILRGNEMKKAITKSGFTLVELAVVIVIIGVLAAFVVPRFRAAVERSKAAGAFNYLTSIRVAQECYNAQHGTYGDVNDLNIMITAPKYFTVDTVVAGSTESLEDSWSLTLRRTGASAGYGEYTVTFTETGFDLAHSTISEFDEINPMQTL
jgi:prepilin-type N-terminal cleavage/methylation domain-containing protein